MVTPRTCRERRPDGFPCHMPPLLDGPWCWSHDPAHAEATAEARRLGGLRRKREATVAAAYDLDGLGSVPAIRRILEIVTVDALGLDNGLGRIRALIAAAQAAAKLLETGELEERITTLEAAVLHREANPASVFDAADETDALALLEQDDQ